MSRRAGLLNWWLATVERPALARLPGPEEARKRFEFQGRTMLRGPLSARREWRSVAGLDLLSVRAKGADGTPRVLWLHGGAYVFGSPGTHAGMAARLSARTGAEVLLPNYPLAPEHRFPAAPEAAFALWRALSADGPLIIGGDSAGGGLALALLARLVAEGGRMPTRTILLSPWTDLTFSGESITTNAASDVLLPPERLTEARDYYLNGADPSDPRASPLFAKFTGASPVHVWVGDSEMLLDDSRRMVARLTAQGVAAELTIDHDLPHVWPIFPGWMLPEADRTLDQMAAAIR